MTAQKQEEIVILQRTILDNAAEYVKPGGVLVFSTCTIAKEENEENMLWFMNNHPFNWRVLIRIFRKNCILRQQLWVSSASAGSTQTDGFFIAKFRRK